MVLLIIYVIWNGYKTGTLNHDYTRELAALNATPTPMKTNNDIIVYADLFGNGVKDKMVAIESSQSAIKEMAAATPDGKLIGVLPSDITIPFPDKDSVKVIKLNSDNKNEFVSMEAAVGPHQGLVFVFGLMDDGRILPVCKTQDPKGLLDCTFWSGEVGLIQFADLDGDKNLEVVEYTDEYPADGVLNTEELNAINNAAYDKTYQASLLRIAKREKGGRGRKVVWAIYKYNNGIFNEMTSTNYDKFYKLAVASNYIQSPPIKKSQLSKDSLSYNEFVYKAWTGQQ